MEYKIVGRSGIRVRVAVPREETPLLEGTPLLNMNTGKLDNADIKAQANGRGNFA